MAKKKQQKSKKLTGAYQTQPISQSDARQHDTGIALPDEENVERNRNWVNENEK